MSDTFNDKLFAFAMEKVALTPEQVAMKRQIAREGKTFVRSTGEGLAKDVAKAEAGQMARRGSTFGSAATKSGFGNIMRRTGKAAMVGSGLAALGLAGYGAYRMFGGKRKQPASYGQSPYMYKTASKDKQAVFEQICAEAFDGEFDKLAAETPVLRKILAHEAGF